jgi:uncharacterized delta-60 repeat protein
MGLLAVGCNLVLGLDKFVDGQWTGGGGSGTTGSTTTTTTGTSSTSGTGGTPVVGDFDFAIKDATVNVPFGGLNYVNVEITPSGAFNDAVQVAVQGGPAGLQTMPTTILAGATTGKVEVGAMGTLALGTTFTLTLEAKAGSISKTASAPAVVTGKPGDLDQSFGSGGIVAGPKGSGTGGSAYLHDIREVGAGKLLVGGLTVNSLGAGTAVGLRYLADGQPDMSFNGTGAVTNPYCSCTKPQGGHVSVARKVDSTLLFVGWGNAGSGKTDDIFLFRYTDTGVPHVVQGDNGTEDIDLGGSEQVTAASPVPQSSQVIVAGAKDSQLFVARIADQQATGFPDVTFAAPKGWIAPSLGAASSSAEALTIDDMGRIVVAGWAKNASMDADVVLLRFTPDGALDTSFGAQGVVTCCRSPFLVIPRSLHLG